MVRTRMLVLNKPGETDPDPEPTPVAKKPSKHKAVKVHVKAPLPTDPKEYATVPLVLDEDIVVEMNRRAYEYSSWGIDIEKQVRGDFAKFGAMDKTIVYDKGTNSFARIGQASHTPDEMHKVFDGETSDG